MGLRFSNRFRRMPVPTSSYHLYSGSPRSGTPNCHTRSSRSSRHREYGTFPQNLRSISLKQPLQLRTYSKESRYSQVPEFISFSSCGCGCSLCFCFNMFLVRIGATIHHKHNSQNTNHKWEHTKPPQHEEWDKGGLLHGWTSFPLWLVFLLVCSKRLLQRR